MNSGNGPATQTPPENINARFHEVWEAIDHMREAKQDRLSAVIWAPLIIWLLTTTVGGVWWAATLNANLRALTATVEQGIDDRYRARDALKDFALQDKDIKRNQEGIKEMKGSINRIELGIRDLNQKIDGVTK